MPESLNQPRVVRFSVFEVDLQTGELRKHGVRQNLPGQPFQVLEVLLERPQELVTREELRRRLWPDQTTVDYDLALRKCINRLREVLGDSAENPRYVETVHRRGYRFIGEVYARGNGNIREARTELPPAQALRPWNAGVIALSGAVVALVLLLVTWRADVPGRVREWLSFKAAKPPIRSLAVLPLQNLSGDPAQEYLSDGMTDALITDLAQIESLRVTSRTSVMRYKRSDKSLPEIARELNVEGVVEGTVQRSGDQVRITAQLIHVLSDRHLWAKTYQSSMGDLFALQNEIARTIAQQIQSTLFVREPPRVRWEQPVNPKAYDAYLKGDYFMKRFTRDSLPKAAEYFEDAIRDDPDFVPAYAKLAGTYLILGNIGMLAQSESNTRVKALITKGLQIDPQFAALHAEAGWSALHYDLDFAKAKDEFKRAVELNPNAVEGHQGLADYYATIGELQQSIAEMERARDIDPLSLILNLDLCSTLYFARRYDEALAQCKATLELDQRTSILRLTGGVYASLGMYAEASEAFSRADELRGAGNAMRVFPSQVRSASAFKNYWRSVLSRGIEKVGNGSESAFFIAQAYTYAGDDAQAMTWLEKALELRAFGITYVGVDPLFDRLRSNPRFAVLLQRMGLAR